jgi:hypothetical protein
MSEKSAKTKKAVRAVVVLLAALLMIAAGAVLLQTAIREYQARKDREVVKSQVILEQMKAIPVYEDVIAYIGKLPEGCTYIAVPAEEGEEPPVNVITYEEAAAIGAYNIQLAMNVEVSGNLFVRYEKYAGMTSGSYEVYSGGEGSLEENTWNDAPYTCGLDAATGEMLSVQKQETNSEREAAEQKKKENPRPPMGVDLSKDPAIIIPEYEKRAVAFVSQRYLGEGREVIETFTDGSQWAFNGSLGKWEEVLDCFVRVEPGTCYRLSMRETGYQVEGVFAYPLGWHSCVWQYWTAEEAAEYPELDENKTVKEEFGWGLENASTPPPLQQPMPLTEEEWADIKHKQKTLGWEGGYPDPEDPNTFVNKEGSIVYVDPDNGEVLRGMVDPPSWVRPEEFRIYEE